MIKYQKDLDSIVTLTLDMEKRPANIINHEIVSVFLPILETLYNEKIKGELKGVVITSAKQTFLTGGDLDYLYHAQSAEELFEYAERMAKIFRRIETLGVPFVAAINGTALGAGYELALACHHRIATNNHYTRIGFPEVTLGIMPGGGGAIRLLWLLGIEKAYTLVAGGKEYDVKEAKEWGLIDEIVEEEEMIERAKKWILANPHKVQIWDESTRHIHYTYENAQTIAVLIANLAKNTHNNYPAQQAILSTMAEGALVDFNTALRIESRYFAKLVVSNSCRNMMKSLWYDLHHIKEGYFRPRGYGRFRARRIGIIGAGMMGSGIAYTAAVNGVEVVLKDVTKQVAERGKQHTEKVLAAQVKTGHFTAAETKIILNRIIPTDSPKYFADCDLIVEVVFENKEVKAKVTREANEYLHREAFIASNTSTLPITNLAEAAVHPEKFIGLHFFSPVESTQLVEIIVGEKTSDETIARAFDFAKQIRKIPIIVRDGHGFYINRVATTYIQEAILLLKEGQMPTTIENAALKLGMPTSPLATADEIGLNWFLENEKRNLNYYGEDYLMSGVSDVLDILVNEYQRKGKTKQTGFYDYSPSGKKLWKELRTIFPENTIQIPEQEIIDRLVFIQCLEAFRCLQEGVLKNTEEGNMGSILGWGFPSFKGGVFQYVQDYGMAAFVQRAEILAKKYGKRFQPPAILYS